MRGIRVISGLAMASAIWCAAARAELPPQESEVLRSLARPPEGWQVAAAPRSFKEDNLWEWINGDAPQVLEYDFSFAATVAYSKGQLGVEVGVLVMRTPLDAFGIYSRRRTEQSKPAPFPNNSFWEGAQLHIWRNYAYIFFLPNSSKPEVKASVQELAEALCEGLPPAEELPRLLTIPPQQSLIQGSLVFYRRNALGQEKLGNALRAMYRSGDRRVALWLFDCADREAARATLGLLAGLLGKTHTIKALGDEAFSATSEEYGPAMAMREDGYVGVAVPAVPLDFAEALLRMTTVQIRIATAGEE
ncbi:MAG: hypothetical protein N2512_10465 [Armatimonadetes bacterium]|nr:hypothetical protein [Armatimonadota bacterium]